MLNTPTTRRLATSMILMVSLLALSAGRDANAQKAEQAPQTVLSQGQLSGVINVSVKGNRLAFASIADYRRAVDEPSEKTKEQFARTVTALKGFTSFAQNQKLLSAMRINRAKAAPSIQDEYFASILNADLAVQIGNYIFRVNPTTERVYALPVANEREYGDLIAENTRNRNIRTFSTGDDVLDVIEAGGKGLFTMCKEGGIGGRNREEPVGSSGVVARAAFDRYGIYFTLYALVTPYGSSGFPYTFVFGGGIAANQGHIYYKVRCGKTADYDISSKGSWKLTYQKYQSYQGSKNLNEVYFFYTLISISSFRTGAGVLQVTPLLGFRVNK